MAFTTIPFDLLGFRVMGDVAGITVYTDRHFRKVAYKKAPPDKPASPSQRAYRDRFAFAVRAWKSLNDEQKAQLEVAVHRASLCLTGQNLFTSCLLRSKQTVYETVARQTNTVLPPLPSLP